MWNLNLEGWSEGVGGRAERGRGGGEGEGTLVCKSRARGVYTVYS